MCFLVLRLPIKLRGKVLLLLLLYVRLTAARRLLAQLQLIDGQSVGSPTQVAPLSFTFHVAFAF